MKLGIVTKYTQKYVHMCICIYLFFNLFLQPRLYHLPSIVTKYMQKYLFIYSFFYQIFSSFTFQMLSPFLVSSPKVPYILPQPTHSCFLALAFPYIGAYNLPKTKGLSSHRWPTRPSSATYATRDKSSGGTGQFILLFLL